jgi:ketosteroid isomerase-like protein
MVMRSGLLIAATLALAACGLLKAEDESDRADARAKGAVENYLKAFRAEDVDAVMQVSGVPFVMNDRGKVDAEAHLRKEFARLFDRSDMSNLAFEVKAVGTLAEVKAKLGEKKHAEKLKAVLKDGDRVVLVDADFGMRKETMAFAVATHDGKALVVGMFD